MIHGVPVCVTGAAVGPPGTAEGITAIGIGEYRRCRVAATIGVAATGLAFLQRAAWALEVTGRRHAVAADADLPGRTVVIRLTTAIYAYGKVVVTRLTAEAGDADVTGYARADGPADLAQETAAVVVADQLGTAAGGVGRQRGVEVGVATAGAEKSVLTQQA